MIGMFPTPVGMNRLPKRDFSGRQDVPHTRGDEPAACDAELGGFSCSPHPWG